MLANGLQVVIILKKLCEGYLTFNRYDRLLINSMSEYRATCGSR